MVLVQMSDFERFYLDLSESSVRDGGGITVLLLVAPDCDALCTTRILTSLLKADRIQYKVKPVSGYSDIAAANEAYIRHSDELRSIVLINCGGRVNLSKTLDLKQLKLSFDHR